MLSDLLNTPQVRDPIATACQQSLVPWIKNNINTYCQNTIQQHELNWSALAISLLFFVTSIAVITILEQFGYLNEETSALIFVVCLVITLVLYFILK